MYKNSEKCTEVYGKPYRDVMHTGSIIVNVRDACVNNYIHRSHYPTRARVYVRCGYNFVIVDNIPEYQFRRA